MCTCPGESELVKLAKSGDRVALGRLLLAHYDPLSHHLLPKLPPALGRVVSVDDLLQQTCVQAHRDIGRFEYQGEGSLYAWLKNIAEHRLQDAIRKAGRVKRGGAVHQVENARDAATGSAAELIELLSAGDPTASQVLARREAQQALQVAIAALPEDQRKAVCLRFFQGRSWQDIADAMDRTPTAVRLLVERAKKKLLEELGSLSRYMSTR